MNAKRSLTRVTTITCAGNIVAVLASTLIASAAIAQEAGDDSWITQARSVATRQAVRDEARAALAAGANRVGEAGDHDFTRGLRSTLTRAQVVAEAIEARRLGLTTGGEAPRLPTVHELDSIRRAGAAAVATAVAAQ